MNDDFVHPSVMEKHHLRAKVEELLEGDGSVYDILTTYDYHRAELEAIQKREGLFTGDEWALIEFLYEGRCKIKKKRAEKAKANQ